MRSSSLPKIVLCVMATLLWLGGSAAAATPDSSSLTPIPQDSVDATPVESMETGPCEGPGAACDALCDACRCGPRWTITAEAIALERTNTRNQPLFDNNFTPVLVEGAGGVSALQDDLLTTAAPLDARDMNFPMGTGFRLSAIRHNVRCSGCDLELAYFQVNGFAAQTSLPGVSRMITDVNGVGFVVDDAQARYTSAIYSGELNLRRQWCDRLGFLAGFRMAQLNEHYRGDGSLLLDGFDTAPIVGQQIGQESALVATNTCNHLYGFQLGADIVVYDRCGPLQIDALCKAGVYDNVAHQDYRRAIVLGGTTFDEGSLECGRDQAAFLGEVGLVATYALTKRLAFRASAEAMWLTGVALAPEQIGAVDVRAGTDRINTSGSAFYYGGGLGLEYRF
jgi:hypothetical protein